MTFDWLATDRGEKLVETVQFLARDVGSATLRISDFQHKPTLDTLITLDGGRTRAIQRRTALRATQKLPNICRVTGATQWRPSPRLDDRLHAWLVREVANHLGARAYSQVGVRPGEIEANSPINLTIQWTVPRSIARVRPRRKLITQVVQLNGVTVLAHEMGRVLTQRIRQKQVVAAEAAGLQGEGGASSTQK
ncbi:hypothetical protein ARMSODRAFT_983004 [Armillaria solidipes]|uniref:Uncharacterized protein n=1 Tax=Armillaria solidipes TaxID=1076256 RepID=A0A2H3AKU8_9AGAR|nr:hypothetical protein ARMSODRAFT_983004 [Armillaria solidipes]